MVTEGSRATEADTVLKRTGELLQGGAPYCIYRQQGRGRLLLKDIEGVDA